MATSIHAAQSTSHKNRDNRYKVCEQSLIAFSKVNKISAFKINMIRSDKSHKISKKQNGLKQVETDLNEEE